MSVLSPDGLGQFLSDHRQVVLIVLSVLELLILLAVFARWYNRRYGLRRTARRVRRSTAEAWRDLIAPIVEAIRLRRGVRIVAVRLTESDPAVTVHDALLSSLAALAGRVNAWPYLVLIGPQELTVGIACPDPAPQPETETWRQRSGRRWSATRPVRPPRGVERGAEPLPLAVGVSGDDLVVLDFGRAPGIVSVHGATAPVDRLVSALATQLTAGLFARPATLLLHDAALDTAQARPLPELTAVLEQRPAGRHPRTVLVCSRPSEGDIVRLTELVERDPGLLVLAAGYVPGSRWRLLVTTTGRVISRELGVDADGAPLRNGLERALANSPAGVAWMVPEPGRPIWADEETTAATADPMRAGPALRSEPTVAQARTPTVFTDDLTEPAAGPVPMARSGAAVDAASPRSGDR